MYNRPDSMDQMKSNHAPSTTTVSLITKNSTMHTSPLTPDSHVEGITPPAAPRELTRISEILDPREIFKAEVDNNTPIRHRKSSSQCLDWLPKPKKGIVHSPSGHALGAEEYNVHPGRPLAIWERQEKVIKGTKEGIEKLEVERQVGTHSRTGIRSRQGSHGDVTRDAKRLKKQRRHRGCWPFG